MHHVRKRRRRDDDKQEEEEDKDKEKDKDREDNEEEKLLRLPPRLGKEASCCPPTWLFSPSSFLLPSLPQTTCVKVTSPYNLSFQAF